MGVYQYKDGKLNSIAGAGNAAQVYYDNTGTSLSATNAQDAITELNTNLTSKQDKTDNTLSTTDKTVVGAINELNNDLDTFSFRNNSGTAQYSMDDGDTWINFKNPTGTKSITANGTYDVTDYASANVNVSANFSYEVTGGLQSKTKTFYSAYNGAYIFMFGGRQNTSNSASETHSNCTVSVIENYIANNYGGYGILVRVSDIKYGSSVTLNLVNAVGGIYGVITW